MALPEYIHTVKFYTNYLTAANKPSWALEAKKLKLQTIIYNSKETPCNDRTEKMILPD